MSGDIVVIVTLATLLLVLLPLELLAAYGRLRRGQVEIASLAAVVVIVCSGLAALALPDIILVALLTAVVFVGAGFAVLIYYLVVRVGSGGKTLRQVWAARDVRTQERLAEWRAAKAASKR